MQVRYMLIKIKDILSRLALERILCWMCGRWKGKNWHLRIRSRFSIILYRVGWRILSYGDGPVRLRYLCVLRKKMGVLRNWKNRIIWLMTKAHFLHQFVTEICMQSVSQKPINPKSGPYSNPITQNNTHPIQFHKC